MKLILRSQRLPSHLYLFYQRFSVEKFIERPKLCLRCGKLNHLQKYCRNRQNCLKCGQDHLEVQVECLTPMKCINCGLSHVATDTKHCPAYALEEHINNKIQELPISKYEAKQILSGQTSYAEIVRMGSQGTGQKWSSQAPILGQRDVREAHRRSNGQLDKSQRELPKRKAIDHSNTMPNRRGVLLAAHGRWPDTKRHSICSVWGAPSPSTASTSMVEHHPEQAVPMQNQLLRQTPLENRPFLEDIDKTVRTTTRPLSSRIPDILHSIDKLLSEAPEDLRPTIRELKALVQ